MMVGCMMYSLKWKKRVHLCISLEQGSVFNGRPLAIVQVQTFVQ
jgi:hypothetical protein